MKYSEFEKFVKEIDDNWIVEKDSEYVIVRAQHSKIVCYVATGEQYELSTSYNSYVGLSEIDRKSLFDYCTALAGTPIEEREEPKKTYTFELEAFQEINIEAENEDEAKKLADEEWRKIFSGGTFGIVHFKGEAEP